MCTCIPVSISDFDFITKYGLDSDLDIPGVKSITGSNKYQTAYRITRKADFRIPTK